MLSSWLFPLLAFVPGIPVVALIFKKLGYKPSVLELILTGFTLWNYVLVAPALLLGLFSNVLVQYFSIFTLISLGICVLSLAWALIFVVKNKRIKIKMPCQHSNLFILLLVICFSFFVMLMTIFNPLYLNADVIAIYLPFSKSIVLTGGLQHEIFHLSQILTAQSPMLPLTYAWVLSEVGQVGLSTLPFVYFSMILVSLFLVAKEIMPKNVAPISLLAFLVLPAVLSTMAYRALYLEIAFTCYFMTTLFMLIKTTKCTNLFYYLLASVSMCLFMLSRLEIATFVAPSFLALLLYFKFNIRFKRIMSTILFSLTFWVRFLFNVLFSGLSFDWKYFHLCSILPLLIAFSVIVYLLLGRIDKTRLNLNDKFRVVKESIVLIFPLFPVAIYLARNVLQLGCINTFFLWNSSYQETTLFFSNILGAQTSVPSVLDVFRWDKFFLSEALIALFFIPFFIGLFYVIYNAIKRKLNTQYLFFTLVFLSYFVFWAWLGCDVQVRRLFVFAPFASIFVAYGTYKFARIFGSTQRLISRFAVYSTLIFTYVWALKVKANTFNDVVSSHNLFGMTNFIDIILLSFIFVAIVPVFHANSFKVFRVSLFKFSLSLSKQKFLDALTLFLCVLLIFGVIIPPVSDAVNEGKEIRVSRPPWVRDVIDYYNMYINDTYTSVVFYAHELIWYANRSVIDLSASIYSIPLISALNEENATVLKSSLLDADIRYFLVPKQNNNYYGLYQQFSNNTLLFKMMRDDPYFTLVKEFQNFELFKLLSEDEIQDEYFLLSTLENDSSIHPLNNYSKIVQSDLGVLVVGTGGDNQSNIVSEARTSLWKNGGDFVELSDTNIDGRDCLKLHILSHSQSNLFIAHTYETPQDWNSEAYVSFWFYGANTNASIPIVFQTNGWQDCFHISIVDDFSGWKYFSIAKSNIPIYKGAPSWNNITRIEMLFGNIYGSNEVTFYLDDIAITGYTAGITYDLPEVPSINDDTNLLIALNLLNDTSQCNVEIWSENGTLLYNDLLDNETTLIKINSKYFLGENTKLVIFVNAVTEGALMELQFIAITPGN